ncbi:MAG TPA: glycosyltransferase family 39 protein [Prolixibacteraceae bacterium]|nr:glycosyltransferase family 39 protein [Prolixibacteraceae bacterium]
MFKFNNLFYNKKFITFFIFIILSGGLFFLMGYNKVVSKGPYSQHSYRQGDSYSFALSYFYEKNSFLQPSTLSVIEDKGGKAVSEFPVLYYITAQIWNFTGVTPFVLRGINLLILFIGLFYLYKLSYEILKDHFWATLVSLFMFSSPLLGFYSFNFMPNIPALGLALIGSYYYYKYYTSSKLQFLVISMIFFSLGALLKISSMFAFLAINAVFFIQNITRLKEKSKMIFMQFAFILSVVTVLTGWMSFAKEYNANNIEGMFQQSIIPIWNLSAEQIQGILDKIYTNTIIYFFNPIALITLMALLLTSLIFWKKTNRTLLLLTLVLFAGITMFILLFFEGMDYHEYFLIDATIIIPAITLTFLTTLKGLWPNLFTSKAVKAFSFVLLLLALNYNMVMTRAYYNPHDRLVKQNIPLPSRVMEHWEYIYWDWEVHLKKYDGIIPYLRSKGIKFEDKVISIPDETPNRTLTLLNQKGFTEYHYNNNYQGSKRTERKIELGAKYLIVEGDENLQREDVSPFTSDPVGEYNGIKIFRLSSNKEI